MAVLAGMALRSRTYHDVDPFTRSGWTVQGLSISPVLGLALANGLELSPVLGSVSRRSRHPTLYPLCLGLVDYRPRHKALLNLSYIFQPRKCIPDGF